MEPHGNHYSTGHCIQACQESAGKIYRERFGCSACSDSSISSIRIDARAVILQRYTCVSDMGDVVVFCVAWDMCSCGGRVEKLGAGAGVAAPVGGLDGPDGGICSRDESVAIFSTINKEWCRYKSAGGDDIFCQVYVESANQAILVHS